MFGLDGVPPAPLVPAPPVMALLLWPGGVVVVPVPVFVPLRVLLPVAPLELIVPLVPVPSLLIFSEPTLPARSRAAACSAAVCWAGVGVPVGWAGVACALGGA